MKGKFSLIFLLSVLIVTECLGEEELTEKVGLLRKILQDQRPESEPYYIKAARNLDRDSLKKLSRAVDYKMDLMDAYYASYLLSIGLPEDQLRIINPLDLQRMYMGYSRYRWPHKLIDQNVEPGKLVSHSKMVAQSHYLFARGTDVIREHLKGRLSAREHETRYGGYYREDAHQLNKLKNIYLLSILAQYLDYFEGIQAEKDMVKLFPKKLDNIEGGGLFFYNGKELEFSPVPSNALELGYNPKGFYPIPIIQEYVPNVGLLHTHPPDQENTPEKIAGPSGFGLYNPGQKDIYRGDLGTLRLLHSINPYFVEIVVTELYGNHYNVDAFLTSNITFENGVMRPSKNMLVVDLGIYHWQK